MNRREREKRRLRDEGKIYEIKRYPPIPSPKVIPLKHKEQKEREIWNDQER